jgi:DNA topoisomerase-1
VPLQVLEGRYGPYITDGEVNASVPKGMDPATLLLDDALALLEARRGAAPVGRKGRRAAAVRKVKPTRTKMAKEPVAAAAGGSPRKAVGRKRQRA